MTTSKLQFTAWSASRLSDYDKCPAYAKYKHLLPQYKGWDSGGAAANRGTEIHEAAAAYVAGHTAKLHSDLKNPKVAKLLKTLRKGYADRKVWVEMMLCFDKKWQLLRDKFSPAVWLRVKCDVLWRKPDTIAVVDYKTGRLKTGEEYDEQLNLYAVGALTAYSADRAESSLLFTDHGDVVARPAGTITREELRDAQKAWEKRVKPMFSDKWHAPKPGRACEYCPYSHNSGREDSPCKF